jgi:hypothetical protein
MRAHINQYKCPLCEMTCTTSHNLRHHINYKHSENRLFPCELCVYKAKSATDLGSHMRKHYSDNLEEECPVEGCDFKTTYRYPPFPHFKLVNWILRFEG